MEKINSFDFTKFIAMFFIVCIHTGTVMEVEIAGTDGETIDKFIEVIGRFAVPFFFITSGFLFMMNLEKKSEKMNYFLKYIKKLFLLYISWFIIYALYDLWKVLWQTNNYSIVNNEEALAYLETLYTKEVFIYGVSHTQYHLWFLPALIWPIIFIYFFYKWKLLDFLLITSFFLHLYGLFGQSYSFLHEIRYTTRDPFFFGLFYAAAGSFFAIHYQRVKAFASRIHRNDYFFILTALFLLQLGERTITVEYMGGGFEEFFLATIPLSILLFFLCIKYRHIGEGTVYNRIGRNAVGIFVIHPLLISISNIILTEFHAEEIKSQLWYGILFTPMIFFVSYFVYQAIQKTKQQLLPYKI